MNSTTTEPTDAMLDDPLYRRYSGEELSDDEEAADSPCEPESWED